MGKHDVFSPKAIAKRMKAKGLTKIRWYCQMCRKACRDANGFKCHCLSESHKRQMEIFGENHAFFIDKFSDEFEAAFLHQLGFRHPTNPVAAKVVYDEYISEDRDHIHMNATRWATLTEFVTYLGRTGKCRVEDTTKGWFIEYIDDPKPIAYKRIKRVMVPEEKQEKIIEKQIEKAKKSIPLPLSTPKEEVQELMALDKVAFKFDSSLPKPTTKKAEISISNPFEQVEFDKQATTSRKPGGFCMSTLDELMREEERAKDLKYRKDHWLCEGIVVKVVSKALVDKGYYNQKGVVMKVIDKYVGEIKMIESSHVLRVDQEELQTVIPNIGGMVKIVNGGYRGSRAKVLAVDERNYCAKVKIEKGLYDGRVIQDIDIEDISRLVM